MKRLVATLVGAMVLLLLVCAPYLAWNLAGEETTEETTIRSYDADFVLDADGDLQVTETLAVDLPTSAKHGIFRFWDRVDPSAPGLRRVPQDITVTRDGLQEPTSLSRQERGRFTVARIGSASVFLEPGVHTYVIGYTMVDAIEPGTTGEPSQFYWNLIPGGWLQRIDAATLTVALPTASPDDVQCGVGVGSDLQDCAVQGAGTPTLTIAVTDLDPNTPVTLKTGLDLATPTIEDTIPWGPRWDRILGTSVTALLLVLLLAAGAGALALLLSGRTFERKPSFPLQYSPPDGVGPAQASYLLTERIGREQYVATLLHAAERGAIAMEREDTTWTVRDRAGAEGWAGLDPVTTSVAHLLNGPGASFTASRTSAGSGKKLKKEIDGFDDQVAAWGIAEGYLTRSALGPLGGVLVVAAAVVALALIFINPFSMTAVALVPGMFAVGGLALLIPGSSTRRTAKGRELWSRAGGFRRVLATPSSKDRFDFSGRQELYTAYVPWAVALGCAKEWAEKYRAEVGSEPPVPTWLPAYAGAHAVDQVTSMVDDFDSTVDGAISAYNATQTSSSSGGSSGGGGFSGGGGGGGGGGGSW